MRERAALNLLLVILAAVPLVLAVANFVLAEGNRSLRGEIERRQRLIGQDAELVRLDRTLVREIAVVAVKAHNEKLRDLLSRNGITITSAPAAPHAARGG